MSMIRVSLFTLLAMLAFAGNSLLCRLALQESDIDPASFTALRILSGALVLWLIVGLRGESIKSSGSWLSALALFFYAAGFSFAYLSLPTGTGALILFAAVQVTMIGYGLWTGQRLSTVQAAGFLIAFGGLVGLLLPGLTTPPLEGALLMLAAGLAWGIYSLRGTEIGDATLLTAGNFLRAAPFAAGLGAVMLPWATFDWTGFFYAILSGAVASGLGYVIWYQALQGLRAVSAATVQLSVPVIAAIGGIIFLGEQLTMRLLLASIAILGGIAMVTFNRRSAE